ncbi:DUF2946 family protein [Phenylobacterium sp.]|uniref:DUF2946 family protein n=1 Tax=Phenylobacterium sp. TaxID=1871053 RepID=UPI0025D27CB2|nr:DUF2946 family protein [Phenylobacterium sp.]
MGSPKNQMRAERRAMIALLAVFCLLVQALVPSLAAASPASAGEMLICTEMGLQTAPDSPGAPPVSHACKHCLCPAPADTPPPVVSVIRVAYAVELAEAQPAPQIRIPPARAPPRPPGQGPPLPNA